MVSLTFGEQVKIILNRKGMTIKELAEQIEICTGKKMSRQNLTQRLGRDNFQEQDMRLIAQILGCPFQLSILATNESVERAAYIQEIEPTELEIQKLVKKRFEREEKAKEKVMDRAPLADEKISEEEAEIEREVTIEDLVDVDEPTEEAAPAMEETYVQGEREMETGEMEMEPIVEEMLQAGEEEVEGTQTYYPSQEDLQYYPQSEEPQHYQQAEDQNYSGEYAYLNPTKKEPVGDINPYTRKEYETNSVRMHPKRIGYVQVYDRAEHKWTDMTEWAFLGFQERKKRLQGKDYIPPTYLD